MNVSISLKVVINLINWIRDTETGELYPVETDFTYEVPAHLETPEYTTIDYDKTREMTIEQLQNQLIAAQNHIEAIESEKTSDNNSVVTVNEVSPEVVSLPEKNSSYKFPIYIALFIVVVPLIFVFFLGLKAFITENDIKINIPNTSEKTVDYEITPIPEIGSIPIYSSDYGMSLYMNKTEKEQPQELQETEQNDIDILQNCKKLALRLLPIIVSIIFLRFSIVFLMGVLRGS